MSSIKAPTKFSIVSGIDPQTATTLFYIIAGTAVILIFQKRLLLLEFARYLRFTLDHDAHYKTAAASLKGKCITWTMPGRDTTFYLSDNSAMRSVFSNSPALDIKHLAELLHFHGWEIPMGQPAIHAADKQVHKAMAKAKIGGLIEAFERYFAKEIARHVELVGTGRPMPLQIMGYRLIYRCVTPTVFGPRYPVEGSRIANQIFAQNVHSINLASMLPVFPYWVWNALLPGARKAIRARDEVKKLIEDWEVKGGVAYASENYQSVARVLNEGNFTSDVKAKWLNTVQFGFLANTGESVGWFLVYVSQSPKLLAKIREEIDGLTGSLSTIDLKKASPHLDSALHETLRLVSAVFAGRRVTQTTTLPGVERPLPKGSLVRTMTRAAVFDKTIWGPDAKAFRGDRFVGEQGAKLYREEMVFGGGASACPGRFFAVHELQVVFATLLRTFNFGPLNFATKPSFEDPDGSFGKPCAGETAELIDLGGEKLTIQFPGHEHRSGVEAISGLLQPKVEPICIMSARKI